MQDTFEENGVVFIRASHGFFLDQPQDLVSLARMMEDAAFVKRRYKTVVDGLCVFLFHDKWPNGRPVPKPPKADRPPGICPAGHTYDKVNSHNGYPFCSICKNEARKRRLELTGKWS